MKSIVIFAGAALVLASFAGASPDKKPKPAARTAAAPAKVHCAVMTNNLVDVKQATAKGMYADYKGNRYFFCCGMCPSQFKADPAKYARAEHIATPKTAPAPKKPA